MSDFEDRAGRLVKYMERINKDEAVGLERYVNHNKSNKFFEEYNLSDEILDGFDEMTAILAKYDSKMKMVGLKGYTANIGWVEHKMIIVLRYPYLRQSKPTNKFDEVHDEIVKFNCEIDDLSSTMKIKERLVYKSINLILLSRYLIDNNGISPRIKPLYRGNKLMYVSPMEYFYTGVSIVSPLNYWTKYILNAEWLYIEKLLKNESLDELINDLNSKLTDILDYEVDNSELIGRLRASTMQRNLDIDTISVFKVKVFIDLISNKEVGNYYREYYKKSGCEIPHIIHSDIKGILNDVLEKGFSGLVINRDPVQGEEIDGIRNLMLNIDPSHVLDLFGLIKKGASTIEFKGINENRVDVNERYIGVEMTKEYMDLFEIMKED